MSKIFLYILHTTLLPKNAFASSMLDTTAPPPTDATAVVDFIDKLQGMVAAAAGAIAVAMIFYGAITLFTAGGNEEKMAKAKKIITYAVGGIVLILLAGILTKFFIMSLGGTVTP